MTPIQKDLLTGLFNGMYLRKIGHRYKLYQGNQNPVMWINDATFNAEISNLIVWKKDKGILSKKTVLQLHGNSWIKKQYKALRDANKA